MNDFNRIDDIESINVEIIGKDFIPTHRGNYNILAGNGGTGKSLIALKMLVHFLIEKPNEQAVAIFSEDTRVQIEERLETIVQRLDITVQEVKNRTFFKTLDNDDGKVFAFVDGRNPVLDMEYFTNFVNKMISNSVGFVVFDPLERFHTGLSENDEGHMKFLVTNVFQQIGKITGASVLVLHHTSKGDKSGFRGSGVIANKGRVAYNIRKNEILDKDSGVYKIRNGWETSVLLSAIKDNHYIQRWCDPIHKHNGKLQLPIKTNSHFGFPVEEVIYED